MFKLTTTVEEISLEQIIEQYPFVRSVISKTEQILKDDYQEEIADQLLKRLSDGESEFSISFPPASDNVIEVTVTLYADDGSRFDFFLDVKKDTWEVV